MIGLLFATLMEARPFLLACRAEAVESRPFAMYRTDLQPDLRIAISGMGKVASAVTCQALIIVQQATRIVNAGACGALHDSPELSVGRLLGISESVEGDHDVFGKRLKPVSCAALASLDLPAARLVTSDRPVFDTRRRAAFAKLGDVVDMEGAAIARVAQYYQVPCSLIKGVSDGARPLDRKTLLQNLSAVSEQIAQSVWQALKPVPGVES
jgi:adenosylhomocysteine nucleosidase